MIPDIVLTIIVSVGSFVGGFVTASLMSAGGDDED